MNNVLEEYVHSQNFVLEPIKPSHALVLFDALQSNSMYEFIPTNPPTSINLLIEKFTKWSKRSSDDGKEIWLNYAIRDRLESIYIGLVQATLVEDGDNYIAYEVIPEFWRRGVATEVMTAFIDCLFGNFEINILTAHIDSRNIASINLIKKLRFNQVGFLKNADHFKGSDSDEFIYQLDKKRWLNHGRL